MKKVIISLFAALYLLCIPAAKNPDNGIINHSFSCMHEYGYHTVYVLNHEKHFHSRIRNRSGIYTRVYKGDIYHEKKHF